MPSANRYENEYQEWLGGTSNNYYESDEQRGRRRALTAGGILAAGLLGGLAYRSGALRPLAHNLMDAAGGIRNRVDTVFDALNRPGNRLYNLREALANVPKPPAGLAVTDDPALIQMIRERSRTLHEVSNFARYRHSASADIVGDVVQAAQRVIDDATADFLKYSAEAEATLFKKTGFRHLTLDEALARNFTFGDKGNVLGQQIQEMLGIDPGFGKRAIDPLIYIDAAGRIRDLRGARQTAGSLVSRMANEFGIPFVGLNPLRMFYVDDIFSNKYKPIIKSFSGDTRQGFVTGTSKPVGNILLWANGKTFNLTGPQFDEFLQGTRTSFDPIAVNTYLQSNQGPFARTARQVMGLSQKRYIPPASGVKRPVYNWARRLDIGFQDYQPEGKISKAIYKKISPWTKDRFKYPRDVLGSSTTHIIMNRAVMPWHIRNMEDAGRFFRQFTAGRHNMRDFTTLSMFPYGFMERLARGIGRVGLGLRPENLGSASQIFGALMTKRVLPVMLGIYGWKYLDYELENLTGEGLNSRIADAWAGSLIDIAKVSEKTGLHKRTKRARHIFPGGEQITELPGVRSLPHLDKTEEEMRYWLQRGEVPIRRGRLWAFNNTPFTGGRIDRYEPNWYRQVKSDWQYTDTVYGSKREYWKNAPIPTPRHLGAPIRHFVTDPYHFEKRHYEDRPYLLTGGFPETEEIPLIGPALSAIASAIFKPRKKMHPEVWRGLEKSEQVAYSTLESPEAEKIKSGGRHIVRERLERGPSKEGQAAIAYVQPLYDKHDHLILQPGTAKETTWRTWANIKDMAGFYGFAPTIVTGRESEPPTMADSRAITSYRRQFWEQDWGGLGGDISEIGRRFIGKREKWEKRYNPIRNTMPEWLPGEEGFIDFQHGDPYCVSPDTLIEVDGGTLIRAAEVTEGRLIRTHKGILRPVEAVAVRQVKDDERVYRFTVSSIPAFPFEVSEDHPLLVINNPGQHRRYAFDISPLERGLSWKRAQDIEVGDYVAYPRPQQHERAQGAVRHKAMGDYFLRYPKIDESLATFMGYYVAEGHANNNGTIDFSFNVDGTGYAEEIRSVLEIPIGQTSSIYVRPGTHGMSFKICCKPFAVLLRNLFGNHARTKHIPSWWIDLPDNVLVAFLRGLFNGDGAAFRAGQRHRITLRTASRNLAYQVRQILMKLGFVASIIEDKPQTSYVGDKVVNTGVDYAVNVNGDQARRLASLLWYDLGNDKTGGGSQSFMDDAYVYCRVISKEVVPPDEIPEVIGFQVGIDDSFCVAGVATHNTKIRRGEIRLPGAAYESLYNVPEVQEALRNPEIRAALARGDLHYGDLYGPLTRFRILADVAPYSDQFREASKIISKAKLTDEERVEVREIREQVRQRSDALRLYPYRFRDLNTEMQTVHITKVIDNNTFLTEEYPDNPIKLAGLRARVGQSEEALETSRLLAKYIARGKAVKVEFDPTRIISNDTYHTIRAVVYSEGVNVNRVLLDSGLVKERLNDYTPASVKARFSPQEITAGRIWESIAHLDTPINTKLLQVRTPLESYERRDLYGKDFQDWADPISDFLVPTYESTIRRSPILAMLMGAFIGSQFGVRDKTAGRIIGAIIGGAFGGAGSIYVNSKEIVTGKEYIPARRRKEWATEEYFDLLKYVKSMRLYQQEAELALAKEDFDVDQYIKERNQERKDRQSQREYLSKYKRRLHTSLDPDYWRRVAKDLGIDAETEKDLKREINRQIEETRKTPPEPNLKYHSFMALKYYSDAKRTMYGSEPGDPMQDIIRALPRKLRNYYEGFVQATDEERKRIREIVPDYFLRVLQPAWGEEPLPKDTLEDLFTRYYLPGPEWAGWRPDVNLNDVRVKFVEKSGQSRSEFNIWPEDILQAEQLNVPVPKGLSTDDSVEEVRRKLKRLLGQAEVRNLEIDVRPQRFGFDIDIETEEDMDERLRYALNSHPW
jgi:hypothetical protein